MIFSLSMTKPPLPVQNARELLLAMGSIRSTVHVKACYESVTWKSLWNLEKLTLSQFKNQNSVKTREINKTNYSLLK